MHLCGGGGWGIEKKSKRDGATGRSMKDNLVPSRITAISRRSLPFSFLGWPRRVLLLLFERLLLIVLMIRK